MYCWLIAFCREVSCSPNASIRRRMLVISMVSTGFPMMRSIDTDRCLLSVGSSLGNPARCGLHVHNRVFSAQDGDAAHRASWDFAQLIGGIDLIKGQVLLHDALRVKLARQ
nr:MAG TPA: hypothetical protein [Bacteriophage sp.]